MDAPSHAATLHLPTTDFQPLRLRLHPGGYILDLTQPDMVLGRHSSADLRMPLPDVSRRHCRFRYTTAGWELVDLDSLNGIIVNGAKVRRALLRAGDQVQICGMEFEVEAILADEEMLRSIAAKVPQRKAS